MAASIVINRWTGATTSITKTNVNGTTNRMAWSDSPADGTSNPIPIPASGSNVSWWITTRLAVTSTGPANGINNLKWYSDGSSFGTGLTCVGNNVPGTNNSNANYVQAVNSSGTTVAGSNGQTLNTTNYANLSAAPVDVTTLTSSAPKALSGSLGAGITNQDFGDYFVYQLQVASTATVGTMTARTFTISYDET